MTFHVDDTEGVATNPSEKYVWGKYSGELVLRVYCTPDHFFDVCAFSQKLQHIGDK